MESDDFTRHYIIILLSAHVSLSYPPCECTIHSEALQYI